MPVRSIAFPLIVAVMVLALFSPTFAQTGPDKSVMSTVQRLDLMRSKLEATKRSLSSAISGIPAKPADKEKTAADADDPRVRLQGLEKEASSLLSEVNDLHAKQDKAERFDVSKLDTLESSVTELDGRVQAALQATASARTGNGSGDSATYVRKQKKNGGKWWWPFSGGDSNKYEDLTSTVAPGRDRELFEDAAKEVRRNNHEVGRLLFTTIINTYPDSPYLPMAKLAIADSFYLEGGTSSLIQAAAAYQDWLTFFPTDPLADAAMLKVAESEMRQMGLPDREIPHARKAEQRLKALLQQYPQTKLRDVVQDRLYQVQENLGMHNMSIGDFYLSHYTGGKGGLKGAQSRYKEIVEKYPCFSYNDKVLFNLAFTYQQEEEPDEAAKYYVQLLQNYPDSQYADKAKEQLSIIGVPVPDKPAASLCPKTQHAGFVGNLMQQVAGSADVIVGKDGILISRSKPKEGQKDLIDLALEGGGQLPSNVTPRAPSTIPVKHPIQNQPVEESTTSSQKTNVGVKIQSTPSGPVPSSINPATTTPPPASGIKP